MERATYSVAQKKRIVVATVVASDSMAAGVLYDNIDIMMQKRTPLPPCAARPRMSPFHRGLSGAND
jgi:hypothetical protein